MEPEAITVPVAFVAGLLSFANPCVLPLVPAYLGYLGGQVAAEGRADQLSCLRIKVLFQ